MRFPVSHDSMSPQKHLNIRIVPTIVGIFQYARVLLGPLHKATSGTVLAQLSVNQTHENPV